MGDQCAVALQKRTRLAWAQAAKPRAVAKWVLPLPKLPMSKTFSRASRYSPLVSSLIRVSLYIRKPYLDLIEPGTVGRDILHVDITVFG